MYWYQSQFFGMHFFWWMLWIVFIIIIFGWMTPVPRRTVRLYREDPLAILRRRYAAGEITTEEYEDRKARIQKDTGSPKP
jgi:putative membrane protein